MTSSYVGASSQLTIGGDLSVNRLGYGAMYLTGPGMWGPPVDRDNAIRLLRRAVELGVNFIDTADSYGPGDNERVIRDALYPYAENVVICTKGGMLRSGPDDWTKGKADPYIVPLGRPAYLRQQVELSLRNLGVDRIDLYLLHSIDPLVPLEDQVGELAKLQEAGKIRHIGISGQPKVTIEQMDRARKVVHLAAVENCFNIADQASSEELDYAEANGIAFIPWFPLGHGFLLEPGRTLDRAAKMHGCTASQLGLAWLLQRSPSLLPIPGTASVSHLEQNVAALGVELSESEWEEIEAGCASEHVWRPGS